MFEEIKQSLHDSATFDVFFTRTAAHLRCGDRVVSSCQSGYVAADGAWWLRSSGSTTTRTGRFKSDDPPSPVTSLTCGIGCAAVSSCASTCWAPTTTARLKAAARDGHSPDTVEVLIGQLVNLVSGGKPVRMSKRAGTVVTIEDLVEAVGVDAARYSLLRSSVDSAVDIDLDLISKRTNENPVFYVQYAHARLSSLQRNAASLGIDRGSVEDADLSLLTHEREGDLIRTLGEYPRVVRSAAQLREPHRVARYLEDLASAYHKFYDACRVLQPGDDQASPLTIARCTMRATRQVPPTVSLLGVSAPNRCEDESPLRRAG